MIVAVGGGKGGVGKTTVALGLAREMRAVLVEGDLTAGDLPAGHGPSLVDALAGRVSPMAAVERLGTVRLLPGGRSLASARATDLTGLPTVLERLERQVGDVVVDCPPGIARDVGSQLASADVTVLVTTLTEAAVHDCYRFRQLSLDVDTPVGSIVLNEGVGSAEDGAVELLEREFGAPTAVLPDRPAVADSVPCGLPAHDVDAGEDVLDTFADVARHVRQSETRVGAATTGGR